MARKPVQTIRDTRDFDDPPGPERDYRDQQKVNCRLCNDRGCKSCDPGGQY